MSQPFVWLELHTDDLGRARSFYTELFGWKLEAAPENPTYPMILTSGGAVGAMTSLPTRARPKPHWLPYVEVSDLEAAGAKAQELGATLHEENVPVPGMGRFTILTDPTGAELALWERTAR